VEAPPEYPSPNRNLDRLLLSRVTGGSACAVVTKADASAALGVPAPRGFAASHIENAKLGGGGSLADLQETGRLAVRRPTPARAREERGRPTLARSSPVEHPKGNMHPLC